MKATLFGWFCIYLVLSYAWYTGQLNKDHYPQRNKAQQCFDWFFWPGLLLGTFAMRPFQSYLKQRKSKKGRK